ncbi:MAG: acylphosphatase [Planctomycetia bacterium]|nr:acylphosphatase [Planctomycetia bacterium]
MAAGGTEARRVLYSGRVQDVGFRYTARRIAQQHAVTGFVRNLDDGRVELVAEGAQTELDALLSEIADAMTDYIRDVKVETKMPTGKYGSFDVTF